MQNRFLEAKRLGLSSGHAARGHARCPVNTPCTPPIDLRGRRRSLCKLGPTLDQLAKKIQDAWDRSSPAAAKVSRRKDPVLHPLDRPQGATVEAMQSRPYEKCVRRTR